jgi:hypothetical protein
MFRLVDLGWGKELRRALHADSATLGIICPFIKTGALERLLEGFHPGAIQVIPRFNLDDFAEGVSDIAALRLLVKAGAQVRGIKNLHAKVYLFGLSRAVVTSANLTKAALDRNYEFGLVSDDPGIISVCRTYFDDLWARGGADLTAQQIETWDAAIARHLAIGIPPGRPNGLGDLGTDIGMLPAPLTPPLLVTDAPQAFVKFFGESDRRVPLTFPTVEEIDRAGCHRALTYPASKRPSSVQDGAVMFVSRLTSDPNDIRVFGRTIGLRHVPGRDDATPADIARRPSKAQGPRYICVHHTEFVAGSMANGVSLNDLMKRGTQRVRIHPTQRRPWKRQHRPAPCISSTSRGRAFGRRVRVAKRTAGRGISSTRHGVG